MLGRCGNFDQQPIDKSAETALEPRFESMYHRLIDSDSLVLSYGLETYGNNNNYYYVLLRQNGSNTHT